MKVRDVALRLVYVIDSFASQHQSTLTFVLSTSSIIQSDSMFFTSSIHRLTVACPLSEVDVTSRSNAICLTQIRFFCGLCKLYCQLLVLSFLFFKHYTFTYCFISFCFMCFVVVHL